MTYGLISNNIFVALYFLFVLYNQRYLCLAFLWPLRVGWQLVLGLCKEDYLQMFKCVCFRIAGLRVQPSNSLQKPFYQKDTFLEIINIPL